MHWDTLNRIIRDVSSAIPKQLMTDDRGWITLHMLHSNTSPLTYLFLATIECRRLVGRGTIGLALYGTYEGSPASWTTDTGKWHIRLIYCTVISAYM